MSYQAPQPVTLSQAEQKLYSTIVNRRDDQKWNEIADSMEVLVSSLLKRKAIPEVRQRLFADPGLAEKGKHSRQQVFESNGTSGAAISRHPHFIPYLRHFIDGPDLPRPVIEGLCNLLNEELGTSGELMDQYQRFARAAVRKYGLDRHKAGTEFFRLAIEIGMELGDAHVIRDAARSAR